MVISILLLLLLLLILLLPLPATDEATLTAISSRYLFQDPNNVSKATIFSTNSRKLSKQTTTLLQLCPTQPF